MKSYSVLCALMFALMLGCNRKPDYSRVETDSEARAVEAQRQASPAPEPDQQQAQVTGAGAAAQASPSPTPTAVQTKIPAFYDTRVGEIKDLPRYPNSTIMNMQLGPMQGVDTALFVLRTTDPVEKVAEFYTRVAKSNRWEVVDQVRETDVFKIQLRKGLQHEGLVQAKRAPEYSVTDIAVSRIEKPPQPKQ